MLRRLQQAIATGEYLMLYMDPDDTGKFCYGRVLAADEDFAALYLIAPDGAYDGLLVKETGSVQRIESGGQYERFPNPFAEHNAILAEVEAELDRPETQEES